MIVVLYFKYSSALKSKKLKKKFPLVCDGSAPSLSFLDTQKFRLNKLSNCIIKAFKTLSSIS